MSDIRERIERSVNAALDKQTRLIFKESMHNREAIVLWMRTQRETGEWNKLPSEIRTLLQESSLYIPEPNADDLAFRDWDGD